MTPKLGTVGRAALVAAAVTAAPLGFMWRTLLLGRPLGRGDDALIFGYPNAATCSRLLAPPGCTLWDPHQFLGIPALACGQTGALYPLHLLLSPLPWMTALHLGYWLHLALALLGFLWVARNLRLSWTAGLLGALAYTFSGYQAMHLVHYNHLIGAAHLPLMLAIFQQALRRNRGRWWALLSAEVAVVLLGSHPQVFLMAAVVCLLWLVLGHDWHGSASAEASPDKSAEAGGNWRRLGWLALALGVAALLVMPQLLPMLELVRWNQQFSHWDSRTALGYMASYPFHLRDLERVLLPSILGRMTTAPLAQTVEAQECCPFIGLTPFLLALGGLVVGVRRPGWRFALATLLVGAVLIPVAGNPIYQVLAHVPLVNHLRAMGRWLLVCSLGLALLASMAVQYLPSAAARQGAAAKRLMAAGILAALVATLGLWLSFATRGAGLVLPGHPQQQVPPATMADIIYNLYGGVEPVLLALAAILTGGYLYAAGGGPRGRRIGALLLALAIILPLWQFWMTSSTPVERSTYTQPPPAAQAILRGGPGRVTTLPPEVAGGTVPVELGSAPDRRPLLEPDYGEVFGLSYADGAYLPLFTGAAAQLWAEYHRYEAQTFQGQVGSAKAVAEFGSIRERMKRFHAVCGVQYMVTSAHVEDPDLETILPGPVYVYRYRQPHPRAWLVEKTWVVPEPAQQLEAIKLQTFEPYNLALVSTQISGLSGNPHPAGEVTITQDEPRQVELVAQTPRQVLLILADSYYPGWQAAVDGAPTEIMRANFAFRAVEIPPGRHVVTFRYVPQSWRIGLTLGAVGLVLLLVFTAGGTVAFWRKLGPPGPPPCKDF